MVIKMEQRPLNIVWFCTDQQRWDTISCLGNPYIKTPNIDKFVSEGVAFTRHIHRRRYARPAVPVFSQEDILRLQKHFITEMIIIRRMKSW